MVFSVKVKCGHKNQMRSVSFIHQKDSHPIELKKRLDNLLEKGRDAREKHDFDQAYACIQEIHQMGIESRDGLILYQELDATGDCKCTEEKYEDAIDCYNQALNLAEKVDNISLIVDLYKKIGKTLIKLDQNHDASKILRSALNLAHTLDPDEYEDQKCELLIHLAEIKINAKRIPRAIQLLTRANLIAEKRNNIPNQIICLNTLASISQSDTDKSLSATYLQEAQKLESQQNDIIKSETLVHQGQLAYQNKAYEMALSFFQQALAQYELTENLEKNL